MPIQLIFTPGFASSSALKKNSSVEKNYSPKADVTFIFPVQDAEGVYPLYYGLLTDEVNKGIRGAAENFTSPSLVCALQILK